MERNNPSSFTSYKCNIALTLNYTDLGKVCGLTISIENIAMPPYESLALSLHMCRKKCLFFQFTKNTFSHPAILLIKALPHGHHNLRS